MLRTRHRRALRLLTTIVVLAVLLAPTVSLASCCCVIARVGQAVGIATKACCDQTQDASCCRSHRVDATPRTGDATSRACCGQRKSLGREAKSLGREAKSLGREAKSLGREALAVQASVLPTECSCEHSCCDGLIIRPAAILTENESSRILHSVTLDTPQLLASFDRIPAGQKMGMDHAFGFLSAPHRCATLCRWLN